MLDENTFLFRKWFFITIYSRGFIQMYGDDKEIRLRGWGCPKKQTQRVLGIAFSSFLTPAYCVCVPQPLHGQLDT